MTATAHEVPPRADAAAAELDVLPGQLADRDAQLAALSAVLRAIGDRPANLQRVLDTISEASARLSDARNVAIDRLDGDEVVKVAHHGAARSFPGERFPLAGAGRRFPSTRCM